MFSSAQTLTSLTELNFEGDTSIAVADWDRDGVLDLLVGTASGRVFFVRNEGSRAQPRFGPSRPLALQSGGHDLRVEGYAAPAVGDWDGDGDLDLVVGDRGGSVLLYRNSPVGGRPVLGEGELLVPPGSDPEEGAQHYLRPALGDWNGDGRLDLLVGDDWMEKRPKPVPTAAQLEELDLQCDELRKLESRLGGERVRIGDEVCRQMGLDWHDLWKLDTDTRTLYYEAVERRQKSGTCAELRTAIERASNRIGELDPPGVRQHGRVWVYLREAPNERR